MKNILFMFLYVVTIFIASFAQIPSNGLIAYYPFNGTVMDSSGNGHNATIVGSVTFGADRFGNANSAVYVLGTGSYIDCGSTLINSSPTSLTQCVWIKTNSSGWKNGQILDKRQSGGSGWIFLEINNGKAMTYIDIANYTNAQEDSSTSIINDNNWHFLCSVKNNDTIALYVDGILQQAVIDNTAFSSSDDYDIGQGANGCFIGYIDDVRIYNRALSAKEIMSLYNLPSVFPGMPGSCDLTPGDTLSFVASTTAQLEFLTQGYIRLPGIYDSFPTLKSISTNAPIKSAGNYWYYSSAGVGQANYRLIVPQHSLSR